MKNNICFVIQRYGLEVNGGAELHCRQIAEHLLPYYHVDVLTSKAIDYMTWKDEYQEEEEDINGVCVKRFSVDYPRNIDKFNEINGRFLNGRTKPGDVRFESEWVDRQGPVLTKLLSYLKRNIEQYDAVIFSTYLYYPSVMGVLEVKDKAIVIPNAHDEPYLRMKIFDNIFLHAQALFFNTVEERMLINEKYHNQDIRSEIGGAGVDVPEVVSGDSFKKKYNLDNYIIYVGRIDEGKNCKALFQYFLEYKKRNHNSLKLVLLGKAVIDVPIDENIVNLGFVSDEDKFNGIAGAKILVLPSEFESLSIVVLEAMTLGIPVVVNGKCEVLKGHCVKSNGGLYYNTYYEFEGTVNYILEHEEEAGIMGQNGVKYVHDNYQWEVVINKLRTLIDYVARGNSNP